MPTSDTPCSNMTLATQTLLTHIDHLVRWLPTREPQRQDLLGGVAQMERHLACETLSRGKILNLQVNVWRLQGGPLRSLLNRRVAELAQLYGLDRH